MPAIPPAIRRASDGWWRVWRDERPAFPPRHRHDQLLVGEVLRMADRGPHLRGLSRGLQALHPQRADGLDLRPRQHAVRHALHDVRRLHAGRGRTRACRLRLHLHEAARPGGARPGAVLPLLHPGHPGAHLRGVRLRRALVAHRRALDGDGRRSARLPLQIGDPARGRAGDAPGTGRDRPVRRVPAHGRLAGAPRGRRGDRRRPDAARRQRVRGRGVAPGRDGRGHAIDEAARHRSVVEHKNP